MPPCTLQYIAANTYNQPTYHPLLNSQKMIISSLPVTVRVCFSRNVSPTSSRSRSGDWFYCSAPVLLPTAPPFVVSLLPVKTELIRGWGRKGVLVWELIWTANSLDQESCQDLGRPYHLTCFLREMEKRRVWGTNCHLRHVARGFSNLCGMRASKQ